MIRAVIIDDEAGVRVDIRKKIITLFKNQVAIVGEAKNVKDGVNLINSLHPDLLLLDIELSDGTSFDLLNNLHVNTFQIIFITGFNEHAIKAVKIGALDYILKPVDDSEFKEAINKAIYNIRKEISITKLINVSNDYYRDVKSKRMVLKTLDTHFIVNKDDIVFCNSEGNYTTFFMADGKKIVISKSIKKVEELISDTTFIKCHQSYLININYIEKYKPEGYFYLMNNIKVPIAIRRREYVLNRLNQL